LKELLTIETARCNTLASFLEAVSVLAEIETNQQEADEEEKMSMLTPARRTALALLAENSPMRSVSRKGDMKEMHVDSKSGATLKFIVPSSVELSSELWCDAVSSEVEWLVEEADFHSAFCIEGISSEHVVKAEVDRIRAMQEGDWRLVDNSSYDICDTYPAYFAVPSSVK
jgi:hypothetical protein